MLERLVVALLLVCLLTVPVWSVEPEAPRPRPASLTAPDDPVVLLPRKRPDAETEGPDASASDAETRLRSEEAENPQMPDEKAGQPNEGKVAASKTPDKPSRIYQSACPAIISGRVEAKLLSPIEEGACHAQSPFEVMAITAGGKRVALSSPATLNCNMATALADWLETLDGYAEANFNSGLSQLRVGTSYMCRPRNNEKGADYSEHGFANGLDVTGFELENGTISALPENWGLARAEDKFMRFAHDAACASFTTTLGPDVNTLHHDHLHLDMGCHGKSCTARLCQ